MFPNGLKVQLWYKCVFAHCVDGRMYFESGTLV